MEIVRSCSQVVQAYAAHVVARMNCVVKRMPGLIQLTASAMFLPRFFQLSRDQPFNHDPNPRVC